VHDATVSLAAGLRRIGWSDPTFAHGSVPKVSRGSLQPNKKLPSVRATRIWSKQLKKVGITYFSFVLHDIGVPAKIAQQQLGHATVETPLNFYTHAIPDTHRRAIESLERALFPVVPKCSQVGDSGKETKVVIR
jgi:integrase